MTMADYVLDLIRRDLGLPSRREWLERLATREPVDISREEILEALDAARAERDDQIAAAWASGSPMPVVIDASALVELLLHSERAPAVLQAVGTTDMVAPDGIDVEVLSMLRRFERTGKLARDLGCPLVTGDLRLSRAPKLGVPLVTV
jgi:hypothetical protein